MHLKAIIVGPFRTKYIIFNNPYIESTTMSFFTASDIITSSSGEANDKMPINYS